MAAAKRIKPGMLVACSDGFNTDGSAKPSRIGKVESLYGPNRWPRVAFRDSPGALETVVPSACRIVGKARQ